jgi:predicted carbohydrate-binding protein with CBM5 and CBM33 domain
MPRKHSLSALGFGATLLVSSFLSANVAFGHGWVTSPPSRQDHCKNHRTSFDCGQVQYEPQSVEAPKGSMQCSGGSSFSILNNDGLGWPVTTVGSTTTFTWFCTACHRTRDWEYFVDGNRVATFSGNNSQPSQTVSHTVSGLPSGRHKILARWNIGDTAAAFYSCIDVNVGGGGGGPTPTPRPTPRPGATPTPVPTPRPNPGGTWAPNVAYSVGQTVTYGGATYRCLQAHTSLVGWEPATTAALWQRL